MTDIRLEDALAEIEHLNEQCDIFVREINAKAIEIERLTDHMRALANTGVDRDTAGIFKGLWQGSEKECNELCADNELLRALVKELADDLEAEVNGRYPPEVRAYPSEQRRYERDMANVYEARRALEPKP